ncbi:TonB-dependent receptor [Terasakiella pusilla]|uniref:TonB-dependent receptor n=1 Tax=Terasakiella pusilla TaxID=64973 RepID=UPI003AA8B81A
MTKDRVLPLCSIMALAIGATPALAQDGDKPEEANKKDQVIVVTGSSSRLPDSLATFPGSITQLDSEDLAAQMNFANDPTQLLGQLVPGLGTSAPNSASNFEQTLRGRKVAIFIDGVPIGTPLRDGRHDVRALSVSAIDSIEVIRGASSLYGNGGVGGVINYITKRGKSGDPEFMTEVGTSFSLTRVDGSLAPFIHQAASGKVGAVDLLFDGFYEKTASFFDADGNRIRPSPNGQGGVADSNIYNVYGKVGVDLSSTQRIEVSGLYYKQQQDTEYNVLIPGNPANDIPVSVAKGPPAAGSTNEGNSNLLLIGRYINQDVFGSEVNLMGYYQDFDNIFDYNPTFFPGGGQSAVFSDKWGIRFDVKTPIDVPNFIDGGTVLWGVDWLNDTTSQPLVDGRIWSPPVDQESLAGFVQASLPIGAVTVSGGIRYEDIKISYPGFTALFSGDTVPAGNSSYSALTFNLGANLELGSDFSIYTSFSQGFSVAEIGRVLRQAGEKTDFDTAQLEAAVVDSYEAGIRFDNGTYSASAATYFTSSDLGTTIGNDLRISPEKLETYGLEFSFDAKPSDNWKWGGSFTWVGGQRDTDKDGKVDRPIASNLVPPAKLTAYVDHSFDEIFSMRLQALHSSSRRKFDTIKAFGEAPITPFTLVDMSISADMGRQGKITLAINNLLNEDYFTVASRLFNDGLRFSKGTGRSARLTYMIKY